MKKININFNTKSVGAWTTLIGAILAAVASILSALGVHVDNELLAAISGLVASAVSLLVAAGVLTQDTDKKSDQDDGPKEGTK